MNGETAALWPNNEVPYVLDEAAFTFKEREIIAEVTCFKMQLLCYSFWGWAGGQDMPILGTTDIGR